MPLFDATMNSGDKTDEWMRKLVGKKIGDDNEASSETVCDPFHSLPYPSHLSPCPSPYPFPLSILPFPFTLPNPPWDRKEGPGEEEKVHDNEGGSMRYKKLTRAGLLQARPPGGAPRYQAGHDGHQGL